MCKTLACTAITQHFYSFQYHLNAKRYVTYTCHNACLDLFSSRFSLLLYLLLHCFFNLIYYFYCSHLCQCKGSVGAFTFCPHILHILGFYYNILLLTFYTCIWNNGGRPLSPSLPYITYGMYYNINYDVYGIIESSSSSYL